MLLETSYWRLFETRNDDRPLNLREYLRIITTLTLQNYSSILALFSKKKLIAYYQVSALKSTNHPSDV